MTRPILLLAAGAVVCGLGAAEPAQAESIFSVAVLPTGDLSPADEVSLEIAILTTSNPAVLLRPTDVSTFEQQISIDIFVGSGPAAIFDLLTEHVVLRTLAAGGYQFDIQLRNFPSPLAPIIDEFHGSFTVIPEPGSLTLLVTSLAALLLRRGTRRTL